MSEKTKSTIEKKFEKEMNTYINNNYKELKKQTIQESTYKKGIYTTKIISNTNKHLFFIIKKNKKKITYSYKKDYLEGNTLFKYLEKKLKKEIEKQTNTEVNILINSTLNQHTPSIQERIIKEKDLLNLKFYIIEKQILITEWSNNNITENIIKAIERYTNNNITPKSYNFIIINKENIKEKIKINNITEDFIDNKNKNNIINDIINNNNSKLLIENNISYEYIKKEDK